MYVSQFTPDLESLCDPELSSLLVKTGEMLMAEARAIRAPTAAQN